MANVRRRSVFYVGGFDPSGAARYHALYAQEAAQQARLGAIAVAVGPRRRRASHDSCWEIEATEDGNPVHTDYEFLQWDSIVRAHWTARRLPLLRDLAAASLYVASSGAFRTMWRAHRVSALVVLLPWLLLCALALLVPLAALALVAVLAWTASGLAAGACAVAITVAGVAIVARAWLAYSAGWIARSLAFTVRQARGAVPELEALLDAQAERVAQRLRAGEDDEVLVVGHSSGSILAVSLVARVLARLPQDGAPRPAFSLLTLGQCIPVLGALPPARGFREELMTVAGSAQVAWIDFSAPPDACCFPLVDPVTACGLRPPGDGPRGPRLLSPRFFQMFDAEEYARRRRDKFTLHFQYLKAGHRGAAYDYFTITAGARTLAARHAGGVC